VSAAGTAAAVFSYGAFISYSRTDREVARRLQRRLETYVLPRAVRAAHTERLLPSRPLRRLFRDEDELVPGRDLPGRIRAASASSRALIVLCSPAAAASPWVENEVREFIAVDESRPIVAVIISGVPNAEARGADPALECLPPSLRQTQPDWVDWHTARDRGRVNYLRIVAAVLSLRSLDQLIRRDSEVRRNRWLFLAAGVAGLALAWGLSLFLYARANAGKASESLAVEARAAAERGHCPAAARHALAAWSLFPQPSSSRKSAEALMYRAYACLQLTWGARFKGSQAILSEDGRMGAYGIDRGAEIGITEIGGTGVRRLRRKAGNAGFPLAFSPSGRILISSGDGATLVWRVRDGALLAQRRESFSERPTALDFSPDESRLLIGYSGNEGLNALYAFSLTDGSFSRIRQGKPLWTGLYRRSAPILMRPEGMDTDGEPIELWTADRASPRRIACEGSVQNMASSRDGKIALSMLKFASSGFDATGRLCVFDTSGKTILKQDWNALASSLAFNRKGSGLLLTAREDFYFLDLATGKSSFLNIDGDKYLLPSGSSEIFSADDTGVALLGDGILQVYDLKKRRFLEEAVSTSAGTPHAFLPRMEAVLVSDSVSFQTLSLIRFAPYARLAQMSRIRFIDVSQPGYVVAASDDQVEIWDLVRRRQIKAFEPPERSVAHAVHVNHGEVRLLASRFLPYSDIFTPATIWNVRSARGVRLATDEEIALGAFFQDGKKVVAVTHDGDVLLFSALSGRLERKLGATGAIPDRLALACDDQVALVRNGDGAVFSIALTPAKGAAAVSGAPIKIAEGVHDWSLLRRGCRGVFIHANYVDGRFRGSEGASLWQLSPARKLFNFSLPAASVTGARFSPSGREVGFHFENAEVGLWNAADGKEIRILKPPESSPGNRFYGFEFSPDGGVLVAGRENDYFWVWNVETGEVLRKVYDAERGGLDLVHFFDDTKMVTTSVADGSLALWDMADDLRLRGRALADALCEKLRRADETEFLADEIARNVFLSGAGRQICA
jgi:WD40 repeat protein